MTSTRSTLLILAAACAVPVLATGASSAVRSAEKTSAGTVPSNARDLPSLLVRWSWKGRPDDVVLDGETAYVRSGGRLAALRMNDGSTVWEKQLGTAECTGGAGPVVFGADVVVAFDQSLFVLEAATGEVKQMVAVSGNVTHVLGPPLLVVTLGDSEAHLLRVDRHLGQITARRTVGRMVYDALVREGIAVLDLDEGNVSEDDGSVVVGFGSDDLVERWRLSDRAFPTFERVGDKVFLQVVVGDTSRFSELDPRSGALGSSLPPRLPGAFGSSDLPWDLELVTESDDRTASTFRRNSFETGQPVWTATLPCSPRATLRRDSELLVNCVRGAGRSTLTTLDWATGEVVRRAAGLRDVRRLQAHDDLVVAETWGDGIVAFDARQTGPPESATRSLGDEVHRVLSITAGDGSPYGRGDHIGNAVADLTALGPDAFTFMTDEVPGLGSTALVSVANVLSEGGYRRAAAPLAARLRGPLEEPGKGWDAWNPQFAVLTSLAKLGGPEEVEAVASVLSDPGRKGTIRRQALATLASIGGPRAADAIDRVLATSPRAASSWWSPPSPLEFARFVGLPDIESRADQALENGADPNEWWQLERAAASVRVPRPDGAALLVFRDSYLGGPGDLWVIDTDASGAPRASARFAGVSIHGTEYVHRGEIPISAHLVGDSLKISERRAKGHSVALKALDVDTDGDGLPDVVERRLRIDPSKADTDGDGTKDSEDVAPNTTVVKPRNENEAIQLAIFRQYFMFEPSDATRELAIVVSDAALKWVGRTGPTITLGEEDDKKFLDEAGYDGIAHIRIRPLDANQRGDDEEDVGEPFHFSGSLRSNERLYSFVLYRGGLNAIGYRVIVRNIESRWVIVDLQVAYVS